MKHPLGGRCCVRQGPRRMGRPERRDTPCEDERFRSDQDAEDADEAEPLSSERQHKIRVSRVRVRSQTADGGDGKEGSAEHETLRWARSLARDGDDPNLQGVLCLHVLYPVEACSGRDAMLRMMRLVHAMLR